MRVLCVDPAEGARRETASTLSDAGFDTVVCGSFAEARDAVERGDPVSAVVTEYDLSDGTGIELVENARERNPDLTGVLFTGTGLDEMETGDGGAVVEYVNKRLPDAHEELVDLLSFSLDNRSQTAYPLPADEDARLDAVEEYVGDVGAFETSLDRLTQVAKALFEVDAATVGFVEAHHERFVACQGMDLDSLDREDTVCTYAILDEGPTVIPDTREDPRFDTNEVLAATEIRFYAGAPIRTPNGEAIGIFCLFDDEPRSFSDRDRELLSLLADEVMDGLEMRRRLVETTGGDDD